MAEKVKKKRRSRFGLAAAAAAVLGVMLGVGVFTVSYAEVPSYFGSDPQTCTNCHVMNDQYAAWMKGSHANAATCTDCHTPHDSIASKYLVKAEDGVLHATKFTMDSYPENIVIRDKSLQVTNAACLHCHSDLTTDMMYTKSGDDEVSCVRCHSGVGHE